ncbi:phosphoenolpyruvate carboxylase [Compostibacter hankyongensis]
MTMEAPTNDVLQLFNNLVGIRFQLYNSLFTALPFHRVEKTGVLLSLFLLHCEEGYQKKKSPVDIIDSFLSQYTDYQGEREQRDLLFRFIQYSERQVVLFDALEDAAFREIHDMQGPGTITHLQSEASETEQAREKLAAKLNDFAVRLVLTAHPTQFYPGEVLGIIHDLSQALIQGNTPLVNTYLRQLGKTPFLKKKKPTPYDEAVSLIWYLENVFYQAAGQVAARVRKQLPDAFNEDHALIRMGFWPGGDRDGNPFVNAEITQQVAGELQKAVLRCYYADVKHLKRRLTFKGVENVLGSLEDDLYRHLFIPGHKTTLTPQMILDSLNQIRHTLVEQHNSLFVHLVENLIGRVQLFGLFFASLDIRQDSSAHKGLLEAIARHTDVLPDNYSGLSEEEKINILLGLRTTLDPEKLDGDIHKDTLKSIQTMQAIQRQNGEAGCHRYIISHSTTALDIMEVYGLFLMSGWQPEDITVDIVPLFETVDDLRHAAGVMRILYENKIYRQHLERRNHTQTIMLGFSDGTKDGGYLMANWSIYKAKEQLTALSREYNVDVIFFDGRGGPPARGGGKTHQFYASMGRNISNKEIQLTVQGQTVTSNFGTIDTAQFNIEQLLHAGIRTEFLKPSDTPLMTEESASLLDELAGESYEAFNRLKNDPSFLEYLSFASPLRYYGATNIGSRPSKRNATAKLNLDDLRAVPYVGAWSQLKQNVPGYYGVGTALKAMEKAGKWEQLRDLYRHSLFFRTLLDNCEMSMKKSFFPLTAYLAEHPQFGEVWKMIHDEFELTRKYLLLLSGNSELMERYPVDKLSIQMRERIVLPLVTIQQYALAKIREMETQQENQAPALQTGNGDKEAYEKLIIRCSFGIINAGRNSA